MKEDFQEIPKNSFGKSKWQKPNISELCRVSYEANQDQERHCSFRSCFQQMKDLIIRMESQPQSQKVSIETIRYVQQLFPQEQQTQAHKTDAQLLNIRNQFYQHFFEEQDKSSSLMKLEKISQQKIERQPEKIMKELNITFNDIREIIVQSTRDYFANEAYFNQIVEIADTKGGNFDMQRLQALKQYFEKTNKMYDTLKEGGLLEIRKAYEKDVQIRKIIQANKERPRNQQ